MKDISLYKVNLHNTFFKDRGFIMETSSNSGLHFKLIEAEKHRSITIPFKLTENVFLVGTPVTSIGFPKIENLYVDLCFEGISQKKGFNITPEWKINTISSSTIVLNVQSETPNGIIKSRFENLSVKDFFKLKDEEFVDLDDSYVGYLDAYYTRSVIPFFNTIRDIYSLDNLTNELDVYQLSLYLTGIPPLKKILLMYLAGNFNTFNYFDEYQRRLEPHIGIPSIAAILSSMEMIKGYFESQKR